MLSSPASPLIIIVAACVFVAIVAGIGAALCYCRRRQAQDLRSKHALEQPPTPSVPSSRRLSLPPSARPTRPVYRVPLRIRPEGSSVTPPTPGTVFHVCNSAASFDTLCGSAAVLRTKASGPLNAAVSGRHFFVVLMVVPHPERPQDRGSDVAVLVPFTSKARPDGQVHPVPSSCFSGSLNCPGVHKQSYVVRSPDALHDNAQICLVPVADLPPATSKQQRALQPQPQEEIQRRRGASLSSDGVDGIINALRQPLVATLAKYRLLTQTPCSRAPAQAGHTAVRMPA